MTAGLKHVNKTYDKIILQDFSLSFPSQGRLCLFGPSGCGKTTCVRILSGLELPDKGMADGIQGKKISYVFQEHRLLPWLTVAENIRAVTENTAQIEELLYFLGLDQDADKLPQELSGGMRRKAAIARALAYEGDIFILDEPFSGIDWEMKKKLMDRLKKETENKLCIFITHDPEEAFYFSDEIFIMEGPPLRLKKTISIEKGAYTQFSDHKELLFDGKFFTKKAD